METRHDFDSIVMALYGQVSAEEALEAVGRLRARIVALALKLAEYEQAATVAQIHKFAFEDDIGPRLHCFIYHMPPVGTELIARPPRKDGE